MRRAAVEATCEFGPNVDALTSVYLYVHDSTYGGWAKTFVDDFRFFSDLDEQIDATFDGNGDRLSCLYTANPPDMPSPPPPPSPPPVPAIPPAPTMHWCEGAVGGDFVDLPLTNDGAGDGVRIITHPDMDFVDDSPLTSGPCSWCDLPPIPQSPGPVPGPAPIPRLPFRCRQVRGRLQ